MAVMQNVFLTVPCQTHLPQKISFSLDFRHITVLENANILYVSRKKIGTEISSFLGVVPPRI